MNLLKSLFSILTFSIFVVIQGCGTLPDKEKTQDQFIYTLADTDWQLESFFSGTAKATGKATLRLNSENNRIAGSAGCNRYFGAYRVINDQIQFSQMGATKMLCQDMSEEDHFFKFMMRINRYQIENDRLILFKDNKPLMQFKATSAPVKKSDNEPITIKGTVTHSENRLLTGNLILHVVLEDVSLADKPAEILGQFEQPISSQVPLKFTLSYPPNALKPGHRYNLRATIKDADTHKTEWLTTEAIPYIPDVTKDIQITVKPIAKAAKTLEQNLHYQCGSEKIEVLMISQEVIKLTRKNGKWILKQTRSASGAKYENGPLTFWIKGKEAMLEERGAKPITCKQTTGNKTVLDQ